MSALQQAYATKKKHHTRRRKMHGVINLAAMVVRWKPAANNEAVSVQRNLIPSVSVRSEQTIPSKNFISGPINYQRKRATSLLLNELQSLGTKRLSQRRFASNYHLNKTLKPLALMTWRKRKEKQLQSFPEKLSEYEQFL